MATVSVMPCSVVLRRLSIDMSTDGPSVRRCRESSTPPQTERGTCSETSDSATFLKDRFVTTQTPEKQLLSCSQFKEPWARVLMSAKCMAQEKKAQNPIPVSPSEDKETTNLSDSETNSSCKNLSIEYKETKRKSRKCGGDNLSVLSGNQGKSQFNLSLRKPSIKKRGRASSVEWDWSGSESNDIPTVPQNRRTKSSSRKKRTPSIDPEWRDCGNESDSSTPDSNKKQEGLKHICHLCNKTFARPWKLKVHLQQHIDRKNGPFVCDEEGCTKSYFRKHHLDRHKSTSHSDLVIVQNVMCEGCKRVFSSTSGLKRHINKVHSEEHFKFQCPTCDKKFSKSKQLRFHIAEHDGVPPLRCHVCNAGAYSDNALRRHARTHKVYKCDVSGCDKTFPNYGTLRKHVSEHNRCFQSKKCAHCDKIFSTKKHLRAHVETHLKSEVFRCTYNACPRMYYQKRNLMSHIRARHEKTSKFKCDKPDCDKIFMSKKRLEEHLNVHENGKAPCTRKKQGPRARRKDAGKPKRAMACKLTGIVIPPEQEKQLLLSDHSSSNADSELDDKDAVESVTELPTSASIVNKVKNSGFIPVESESKREEIISSIEDKDSANFISEEPRTSGNPHEECDVNVSKIPKNSDLVLLDESVVLADTSLNETFSLINDADSVISNLAGKVFQISEEGELVEVHENLELDSASTEATVNPSSSLSHDSATTVDGLKKSGFGSSSVVNQQNSTVSSSTSNCSLEKAKQDIEKAAVSSDFVLPLGIRQSLGSSCIGTSSLSATLCAQAIVEVPLSCPQSEVLVVVPKSSGNIVNEMNTAAVLKALSGDAEVYSVVEGSISRSSLAGLLQNNGNQASSQEIIKRIPLSDASVSNILRPLIKSLENEKPSGTSHDTESFCFIPLGSEDIEKMNDLTNEDKSINDVSPGIQPRSETLKTVNSIDPVISGNVNAAGSNSVVQVIESHGGFSPKRDTTGSLSIKCKGKVKGKGFSSRSENCVKPKRFLNPAHLSREYGRKKVATCVTKDGANLSHKGDKNNTSNQNRPRQIFHNPAFIQRGIWNLAQLNLLGNFFSKSVKHKSFKGCLQGPSEDSVNSDSSSSSDSENNSQSGNSSSEDTDPELNSSDSSEDSAGDSDGNGDDEEEEEEEEVEEQTEDEENDEEDNDDDDNEENGHNHGPNEINGGNNDGNDIADNSNSRDSDRHNGHNLGSDRNVDHDSHLGIDRLLKIKPNENIYNSDGGNSSRSDNLIIVTDETEREEKDCSIESPCNVAALSGKHSTEGTMKSPPQQRLSITQKLNAKNDSLNSNKCNESKLEKNCNTKKRKCRKVNVKSQWYTSESSDNEPLSQWLTKHTDSYCRKKRVKENSHESYTDSNKKTHQKRDVLSQAVKKTKPNIDNDSDSQFSSDFEPKKKRVRRLDSSSDSNSENLKQKRQTSSSHQDKVQTSKQGHPKNRIFNLGAIDDSDPDDPSWKPIKEEDTDDSYELVLQPKKEILKPEQIYLAPPNTLKMCSPSPTLDPLNSSVKEEISFEQDGFVEPLRSGVACSQLSESAWINVLRQVSRTLKLSPSVVE